MKLYRIYFNNCETVGRFRGKTIKVNYLLLQLRGWWKIVDPLEFFNQVENWDRLVAEKKSRIIII